MLHGTTVRSPVPRGILKDIKFVGDIPWDEFTIVTAKDIPGENVITVIEKDWQTVALLRPIATAEAWENKYSGNNLERIVEIKEAYQEDKCKLGKIVPCKIEIDDGGTITIHIIILFREIDGQRSCVIANTWAQSN